MVFKLPDSLDTNNPKEAIAYCIANGIEEDILPRDFKMSDTGYRVLEQSILAIWNQESDDVVNQIMIAFIAGYAVGSQQVTYKDGERQ